MAEIEPSSFVGYQGQRLAASQTGVSTTFTPAELTGDFSHSNSTHTGPDPNVVAFLQANPFFQPSPALETQGIISPARINSVAQKYITNKLIPTSATGTLFSQGGQIDNTDELTIKGDVTITAKDRLSVTLGSGREPTLTPFSGGATVPGYGITGNNFRKYATIAYTRVFSPTLINEFRFTAQRIDTLQAQPQSNLATASTLGIGITPDDPTGPPRLSFAKGLTIGFSPQGRRDW